MNSVVLLDAGPLGLLSSPRRDARTRQCRGWLASMILARRRVIVPEIADYEVRRELIRAGKSNGLANLDQLGAQLEYLPLSTAAIRMAASLWAQVRQQGKPTTSDAALDVDAILAAQALTLGIPAVTVATTNLGHLSRFVSAQLWEQIAP